MPSVGMLSLPSPRTGSEAASSEPRVWLSVMATTIRYHVNCWLPWHHRYVCVVRVVIMVVILNVQPHCITLIKVAAISSCRLKSCHGGLDGLLRELLPVAQSIRREILLQKTSVLIDLKLGYLISSFFINTVDVG